MKILILADIHQLDQKWHKLAYETVPEVKPDIVAIAGDILPKSHGILAQYPDFISHLKDYAQQIKNCGSKLVMILGNDDNTLFIPVMEQGEKDGLWYYPNNKVIEIDGYEFVGYSGVPDYPFSYKAWCRAEYPDNLLADKPYPKNLRIDPTQYGTPGTG